MAVGSQGGLHKQSTFVLEQEQSWRGKEVRWSLLRSGLTPRPGGRARCRNGCPLLEAVAGPQSSTGLLAMPSVAGREKSQPWARGAQTLVQRLGSTARQGRSTEGGHVGRDGALDS